MKYIFLFISITLLSIASLLAQPGDYAIEFDGSNDYVEIPNTGNGVLGDHSNNESFTIETWFQYAGVGNFSAIFTKHSRPSTTNYGYFMEAYNNSVRIGYGGNPGNDEWNFVNGTQVVNDGKWHHLAYVYDNGGTGTITLYIDGVLQGSSVINVGKNPSETSIDFRIASSETWGSYTAGKVDELRVWNDIRSQAEINTNMYKELAGNEANLVAYYKVSKGSGSSLTDNSTNSYTGILNNMDNNDWVSSGCFAGPGNALDFDGSNDFVTTGAGLVNFANDMTVEGWFNTTNSTGYNSIVTIERTLADAPTNFLQILTTSSGNIYVDDANDASVLITTESYNDGNWHHIAFVRNSGIKTFYLYVDGVLRGTRTYTTTGVVDPDHELRFGNSEYLGGSYEMDGMLDEIRIWDDVRTIAEIRENMMTILEGDETGLLAYYRFDQQDGTTLYDVTGNGYNGTLTNMDENTDWVSSLAFNTWLGGESNAWSTAANWSRGAIATTDNVGIYELTVGNYPSIPASQRMHHMVLGNNISPTYGTQFNPQGNLHVLNTNTFNSTFTVNGDMVIGNNATFNFYPQVMGDLYINSAATFSSRTTVHGTLYVNSTYNFTDGFLSANSDVHINADLTLPPNDEGNIIQGNLHVASGTTLNLSGDCKVTVNGNLVNAGTINMLSTENVGDYPSSLITTGLVTNTGTMNLDKWINYGSTEADNYTWYSMGLPLTTADNAGTYFLGDFLYSYNEGNNGWNNIVPEATPVNINQGYIVKTLDDAKTITFSGTLYDGDKTFNINNTGPDASHGYNMVYNPYPSSVDIDATDRTNLSNTIWMWDPVGQTYRTYQFGTIGDSHLPVVGPCQGFFVKVADDQASGSLTFTDDDREHQTGFVPMKAGTIQPFTKMSLKVSSLEGFDDNVYINIKDQENDGYKLFSMNPSVPQLYAKHNNKDYGILNCPELDDETVLALGFKTRKNGKYTIEAKGDIYNERDVFLKDKKTSTITKLEQGTKVTFEHAASNNEDRFELIFKNAEVTDFDMSSESFVNIYPVSGNVAVACDELSEVSVYSVSGQVVKEHIKVTGQALIPLQPGIYVIKAIQDGKVTTEKVIIR
ncbi:T9SS type A sorting domain-containing protein [Bacteroidales bacterium]|nr:T9SS type A sorting domain-containing protein [Bacteroidales bacterium]